MTQFHSASGTPRACPDVGTLADLHAGLLDDSTAAELREHVGGCAACQSVLEALDATVASLAALPAVQMPAHVAARLDHALAVESGRIGLADDRGSLSGAGRPLAAVPPSGPAPRTDHQSVASLGPTTGSTTAQTPGASVTSLAEHRQKKAGRGRLLLAAAAAAVVVGGGAIALGQNGNDSSTQANNQAGATLSDEGSQGNAAPGGSSNTQAFAAPKDVLDKGAIENNQVSPDVAGKMAEQGERTKCLSQIVPRPASAPEAVQAGTYGEKAAYAFIFPTKDDAVVKMIVVDASDCSVILHEEEGPRS